MDDTRLVVNCGSSSLKLALFDAQDRLITSALAERLNSRNVRATISGRDSPVALPSEASHTQALEALIDEFRALGLMPSAPSAIGHRVVHGGETFRHSALIDDAVREAIDDCSGLAPLHNPVNLTGIDATRAMFPRVPQVAVFDTAFHQTLPRKAFHYAVPEYWYRDWGVRRYGFHGTSHKYMAQEAARRLGQPQSNTSIISCHLGNGCSITAIRNGISVDTSMGLTPLEGLVMGTRSGDVDPGLFDYLATKGLSAKRVNKALNSESGLLGISGQTNDMRTLCDLADNGHEASNLAIDIFCFRLAKYIGGMMTSLSRLDALVFTGGIGENSPRIRQMTLENLAILGFSIDHEANKNHGRQADGRVDEKNSRFPVLVIPTNEELVIAREAARFAHAPDPA